MTTKSTKVKGEVQTLEYVPGERLAESKPPDEGPATLTLAENKKAIAGIGKGWKAKPGKYPNKLLWFKVLDTEDEVSGKEKEVRELISLSPGALRRGCMKLAQASQYPLKIQLGPDKTPNHPTVRSNAIAIDKMLQHIKENELVLRGEIFHEEYNGEMQGNVKWLPPEELEASGDDFAAEGEAEAPPEGEDDVFGTQEEGAEEEQAEDAPAEEEVTEEATEEEAPAEEEAEPEAEQEEEAEFEPVPPPLKKTAKPAAKAPVKAPSKVVQPGQKKPAAKPVVKGKKK